MGHSENRGLTLIELMVTLAIVAIGLSLAVVTVQGYLPKQHLISTAGTIENLLQRAQSEANARSYWTCVWFQGNAVHLYVDVNGDHGDGSVANGGCGNSGDLEISKQLMNSDVALAGGSSCGGLNVQDGCVLWFDPTGAPKRCPSSLPNVCGGLDPASCVDGSYSIVVSNNKMASGTRAREVEVIAGGIIQLVKPGDPGLNASVTAASAGAGCE